MKLARRRRPARTQSRTARLPELDRTCDLPPGSAPGGLDCGDAEMTQTTSVPDPSRPDVRHTRRRSIWPRPGEVLKDPKMSRGEKRALLASWASDAHAVPGLPSMRQLNDEFLVEIDEILEALKELDASDNPEPSKNPTPWRIPPQRWWRERGRATRHPRRGDDGDDEPPCPVLPAPRPKTLGGGAFACPEPALA